MTILNYRKANPIELADANIKCDTMKDNHMQCDRRVTRVINNNKYLCEGHFQIIRQIAVADKEEIIDQDEQKAQITGESEP